MKTRILILSVAIFIAGLNVAEASVTPVSDAVSSVSKQFTDFSFFRIHRQGKLGVTVTWGMTSGDAVAGFVIQRTYQDPTDIYSTWEDISTIAASADRSYKYTDNTVDYALSINYRVIAVMSDNSTISSPIESIKIMSH